MRCDLEAYNIPNDERERLLQLAHITAIPDNDEDVVFKGLMPKGPVQGADCKAECMCKSERRVEDEEEGGKPVKLGEGCNEITPNFYIKPATFMVKLEEDVDIKKGSGRATFERDYFGRE